MNSDLASNVDDLTSNFDDPCTSSSLDALDAHIDTLLRASLQQLEEQPAEPETKRLKLGQPGKLKRVFAKPKTEEEVAQAKLAAIPAKTLADTNYCIGVWMDWTQHRLATLGENIPPIEQMTLPDLEKRLSNFIFEVRKKNGDEFPPKTLHHLISGIQRHLRMNGKNVDLFKDPEFADMRVCLDSEMKRLQKSGLGSKTKKAVPLTIDEEELLWSKGLLGSGSPQILVDTMLVMNGLYFALRSGSEHRQLRADPCQITLHEPPSHRPYLEYIEDFSKNRSGGLKGRKLKPKIVQHHSNPDNPERCFVELFQLYRRMCPTNRPKNSFYLQPLEKPTPTCWYSCRPIGHNKLEGTVARLCQLAGIPGYRTNHSLRATTATRLYQAGVDEQLIMERTGHRSLDGVRRYKHTSMPQKEVLSDILNCQDKTMESESSSSLVPMASATISSNSPTSNLSSGNTQVQVCNTTSQSLAMSYTTPPVFNFHSCSVTIINGKQ